MLISDLVSRVLLVVRQAPRATVLEALRQAVDTFCVDSRAWQEELDPIVWPAGVATAELDLPNKTDIVIVTGMKLDGNAAVPVRDYTVKGTEVTLASVPVTKVTGTPRAALRPAYGEDFLDDSLGRRYAAGIVHGAIAILKANLGAEWSDPNAVAFNDEKFQAAIASAWRETLTGGAARDVCVTPAKPFV